MVKYFHYLSLILITSALLTSCGFAPHTMNSLPPELKEIHYQAEQPYETFEINLKKRLKTCRATLLSSPKKSAPIIYVSSNYNHATSHPATSTQARIYTLTYTATVKILDTNNKELLAPQKIIAYRDITLQPNEIFETTPQITIAKQEIAQELSTKTLNILNSKKTIEALQKLKK